MKRSSLFVSIILCLALLLSLGATGVFAAEEGQEAAFVKNWGMTLNDEIVLKFEMGEIPAGATEIKATVGGRTYTAPASQQIVSVPVYATQMTEAVTLAAVDADGAAVASRSFTVLTYLQSVLDNALFASYHPLVKELLNYGSAAQLHFIGSSDITVSGAGQTAVPGNASAYAIDDQSDLMDCTGASLVYREKIALRFYFDVDPTGCTFTVNGEAAALTVNEAGKYVEIADILPQNLDQQVVLSVTDADGRAVSVTYSPLTYIVRMSQKGSDTTKALVKALYNYHLAAKAFVPLQDFVVSFDLGYNGEAIADRIIAVGDPYGQLPTPAERAGYTFGGWMLENGTVVTADTKVTASHTLYAKWDMEPDTNPVVVQDNANYNPSNAKLIHTLVNGEHLYTYTTKGVAAPAAGAWSRRLNFTGWEEGTKYVAIEFRFTEAKTADGTDFAPSLGVYNGQSGVGYPRILDANGKVVAEGNATTGLTVGQWYTAIVSPGSYSDFAFWPAHNHQTDAPQLTMEIRTRACTADPGLSQDGIKFETAWGDFADPSITYINGNWCYAIGGAHQSTSGEHRQMNVTLTNSNIKTIEFEFMMNSLNNTYVKMPGGVAKTITNLDGSAAGTLQTDTWYKVTATSETVFSTSKFIFGYLGGDHATPLGGLNVYIRNVVLTEAGKVDVSFDLNGAEGNAPAAIQVMEGSAYGTLPEAPTREFYTFGGWMLENGTVVTADTKVTASHTLYAKWELMPDPNSVAVGFVTDGTKTVDIVDGQYVYTYTTAGKTTHGGNPKRKVNISFPEGQDYVYVEFRFTESKTAAGADLAPYLRVYDPSNSGNGGAVIETIWIYDSNGKQVAKNNSETGLALNEWHTLVVKVKGGTNINMCALSHYATDVPLVTMEIRERNCVDDNSSVVIQNNADYNAAHASMTHSLVDGKSFFTYTTRGVSSPTTSPGNRRVEVYFPANQQTHVAVEFRYTEAFAADGVTPIAPTLRVYDKNNGGNGGTYISTLEIFDANGNAVASANALNSLTVGEWYTLVVGLKTDADLFRLWPCPGYTTDAAVLTMEFRDWHAYTDPSSDTVGIKKAGGTYENIFPKTDGSVVYKTYPVAANTSAYNRRFNITNSADAALVKFDFVFDVCEDANGNPVTPNLYVQYDNPTDKGNYVVTDANGDPVLDLVVGEKYTMWITTYGNTSHDINVVGNCTSALKAQITITDREVVDVTTGEVTLYNNAENYGPLSLYKVGDEVRYGFSARTGIQNVPTSGGAYTRRLFIQQAANTYNQISFEFKYTVADKVAADGTVISGGSMTTTGAKYYTLDGTEVSDNFTVGTWYKAVLTTDSTFGASVVLYPMGYSERPADGQLNMAVTFRNIQATKPEPKIPALVANAANGLTEVSAASAGIETDQKVWKYVKASGSADGETAAQAVYFSNEDGYDYISFDFCFTACNAAGDSSFVNNLPYICMKGWYPSGNTIATANYLGLTIVEKATGQAPNVTASYTGDLTWGNVEMNKWYTMKCKVTGLSRLHIILWTSTTAEMYITNIKGE